MVQLHVQYLLKISSISMHLIGIGIFFFSNMVSWKSCFKPWNIVEVDRWPINSREMPWSLRTEDYNLKGSVHNSERTWTDLFWLCVCVCMWLWGGKLQNGTMWFYNKMYCVVLVVRKCSLFYRNCSIGVTISSICILSHDSQLLYYRTLIFWQLKLRMTL